MLKFNILNMLVLCEINNCWPFQIYNENLTIENKFICAEKGIVNRIRKIGLKTDYKNRSVKRLLNNAVAI